MATVHWSLELRGRLRPKAVLVDGDGRDLARVLRDGRVRAVRAGGAVDPEGGTWRVVGPPDDLRLSCDGVARATIADGVLEAGEHAFGWRLPEDGSRTLRVTSAVSGGTVLRIDPGDGDAWARIAFEDALPEPFGVIVAACVRLLEAEDPIWGPGGRRASVALASASPGRGRPASESGHGTSPEDDRPAAADDACAPPGRGRPAPESGYGTSPEDGRRAGAGGASASWSVGDGGEQDASLPGGSLPGGSQGAPAATGGPTPAAGPAGGAPSGTRWALFVQGRVRPKVLLTDGGADPLATLDVRGGPTGSLGKATDRDGRRWVAELDGGLVTMRCGGRAMARAEKQELTVGGRTLAWRASLEGARTATATDDDGRVLLWIEPGPGGDGAWAEIALDDALPSPLAATLASLFVLLRVDALGRRG